MYGMNKIKKRRCGDCLNINCVAYGPKIPVCYELTKGNELPMATAVSLADKRAEFCGHFKAREETA